MITNDGQYRTTKTLLGQFEEQPETWRRPVRRTRSCTSCRLTLLVLRHAISRASRRVRALRSGARPTRSANCTLRWSEPVLPGDGRSAGSPPSLGSRSNRSSVTRRAGMRRPAWPGCARSPRHSVYVSARPLNSWPTSSHRRPSASPRRHPLVARKIHAGRYRFSAANCRNAFNCSAVHALTFGDLAEVVEGGVAASATLRTTRLQRRASLSAA